jgi:hypothetical protein
MPLAAKNMPVKAKGRAKRVCSTFIMLKNVLNFSNVITF